MRVQGDKNIDLVKDEYTEFRSLVGALQWMTCGTRPDLAFDTLLHSCKMKKATREDLFLCGKTVKRAKILVSNKFSDLGCQSQWKLIVFSDSSYANLPDGVSSSFAYVVLLVGSNGNCCLVSWKANKVKRVCRSTLAAETIALVEGIEECLYLRMLLGELGLFTSENSIMGITDNFGLQEAIYSTKLVDDKQTRIDIAALQQMLKNKHVHLVKWCPTDRQLANALTKKGANTSFLLDVITSGRINLE